MATSIYKFDGTLLTTVADGTIDTTHSSLKFPGKGYQNYGEPIMEDILWTMTNFAGAAQPALPLTGQGWYNTSTGVLNIYNGTSWQAAGGVLVSSTKPTTGTNVGAFWYDSSNLQLSVWNGTTWNLVGPLGSATNNDPINSAVPTYSQIDTAIISDGSINHQVWRLTIGGTLFAIISKDATFTPAVAIAGFSTISPGINFNSNVGGVGLSGDSTTFKNGQNNIPSSTNKYSLGSSSYQFSAVYTTNGIVSGQLGVGNITVTNNALSVGGTSYLNGTVTLKTGSTTAAPLLFQSGSILTTPQIGALEFDGNQLYITVNTPGSNVTTSGTRYAIAAGASGTSNAAVAGTIVIRDSNANITANLFIGTATSAFYADVAERYETDTPVGPGDVVILGGEKEITTTTIGYDSGVFGVVSTNPAVRMNELAGDDATHPFVAMLGRVPCKVIGPVRKGQRLVTSGTPGVAMANMNNDRDSSFARSLVNKDTDDVELIEVVLLGRA